MAKSNKAAMSIYGIDFTSAPSPQKPLVCAECIFDGKYLRLEELTPLYDFKGFEALLGTPGPWILGLDLPFGQPLKLIQGLQLNSSSWEAYVQQVEKMGKGSFEETLRRYMQGREKGDILHKREVDRMANAQSPMKLDFIPVGKMFFEGAPRLAKAAVNVLPCRPTEDERTVVEAYPALVPWQIFGKRRSYKEGKTEKQRQERKNVRKEIVGLLSRAALHDHYGFTLSIPDEHLGDMIEDKQGDYLDSVFCAIQATWAYIRQDEDFGIPSDCNHLEGWIVNPDFPKPRWSDKGRA